METNRTEPNVQMFIRELGYTGGGGNRAEHREIFHSNISQQGLTIHKVAVLHSKGRWPTRQQYSIAWIKKHWSSTWAQQKGNDPLGSNITQQREDTGEFKNLH